MIELEYRLDGERCEIATSAFGLLAMTGTVEMRNKFKN